MCRVSEWLDRSDTKTMFAALINRIKQARTDQGQGHYLCSLQGAVVEIRTEVEQRGSRERSLRVARDGAGAIRSVATTRRYRK